MLPTNDSDNKRIFSELIKKQMLILGPDITLAKVKNVSGITVDNNGEVQSITGDPQQLLQLLINQFVELSGMIVKKTMESILTSYPGLLLTQVTNQNVASASNPIGPASIQNETVPLHSISSPSQISADRISDSGAASVNSQTVNVPSQKKESVSKMDGEPPQFSQNQMDELNRALEQLSKSPLSTESNHN